MVTNRSRGLAKGLLSLLPYSPPLPRVLSVLVGAMAQSGMTCFTLSFIGRCCSLAWPGLPLVPANAGGCYNLPQPELPLAPAPV